MILFDSRNISLYIIKLCIEGVLKQTIKKACIAPIGRIIKRVSIDSNRSNLSSFLLALVSSH